MKYLHDESYFHKLNTVKSYWAGFIAADGYVRHRKEKKIGPELSLKLSIKDMNHLLRFKNAIQATNPIKLQKQRNICDLTIYSASEIVQTLKKKFNITNKKSLTLLPPNLKRKDLIKAYIIGYIDGDGCIGNYIGQKRYKNRKYAYNFLYLDAFGTISMMKWIKKFLENGTKIRKRKIRKVQKSYRYTIYGKDVIKVFNYLFYKTNTPNLHRKWSIIKIERAKETDKLKADFKKALEYVK